MSIPSGRDFNAASREFVQRPKYGEDVRDTSLVTIPRGAHDCPSVMEELVMMEMLASLSPPLCPSVPPSKGSLYKRRKRELKATALGTPSSRENSQVMSQCHRYRDITALGAVSILLWASLYLAV